MITDYLQQEREGAPFTAQEIYDFARELQEQGYYRKAVLYYKQYLQGDEGDTESNISTCLNMAECYGKVDQPVKRLESLLQSLAYGKPQPEASCAIGFHHLEAKRYEEAIYWFQEAIELGADRAHKNETERAHATWIPHLQLCLCYDRLGQMYTAFEHNEKALAFHPTHPSMLYNHEYYLKMFGPLPK